MLRLLVLLLLLANGAFFAWSQGLLAAWGIAPTQQSEPQRLTQQIRPEALRILTPDEARSYELVTGLVRGVECLQAGPLEDTQLAVLRPALEAMPAGSWSLQPGVEPPRWIVYMGRYPDLEAVNRKKGELRQIRVSFEPLVNPSLELGLSLGGFASEAAATDRLNALAERGVRTARVLVERPELRGQLLRFQVVDESLRPRINDLTTALGARPLRPCR